MFGHGVSTSLLRNIVKSYILASSTDTPRPQNRRFGMDTRLTTRPVRGIIFDLDGTMYTISWLKVSITLGLLGDLNKLRHFFPVRSWLREQQPFIDEGELKRRFAEELSRRAGGTPEKVLHWYENRFMPRFAKVLANRAEVRDGLTPLLERLRDKNVRLAVVSDFGQVPERLDALGIPKGFFEEMVGAEAYGTMKPTATPYRVIARKWQTALSDILLVGDREDLDAGSAALAGTQFIGIAGDKRAGPDFVSWPAAVDAIDRRTSELTES